MSLDTKEKQVLVQQVMRRARCVSLELKRSFLFHYFISNNKKGLKDLAMQLSKFGRFNKLVKNMNKENLKRLEGELNIFEEEIKKVEKEFKFWSYVRNESNTNIRKKKNSRNKKGKVICPRETEDLSCKKSPKNKLLQMATG